MGKQMTYLNYLIEQFKQATGTKNIDINSQLFISEFSEWIRSRQNISENYLNLLEYMELYRFADPDTAEIGKGQYDSIVKPFDTTIITPHSEGLETLDQSRIITSDFRVFDGTPVLTKTNEKGINQIDPITSTTTLTFMTQNPYTPEQIRNWEQLHNSGENNIIVGIYGSIYDKDIEQKIKELEALRDKLYESYKEEHTVIDDTYCYAIASERMVKRLFLERTRRITR